MLKFIDQGGPFVWVLLVLSFVGMMIVLEKIIFFQRTKIHVGDLMLGLANHVRKGAHDEALREAARAPGSVARVAHATLMRYYLPRADLRDIAMEAGQMEVPRIEKNLRGLYTVALIAPLIGMLGTVNGLIDTFVKMSNSSGLSSNLDMAKGIYEALITTGLGLLVAVPAYLFYLYFVGRVKRLVHRIERGAIEIVNIICDERDAPKSEEIEISDVLDGKDPSITNPAKKASKKSKK
ncbi:MAG: MotA/TolQ/ExbB proton channel family protein [Rubritalea sp.]|jgi:biopolymer transport protein ExbB|tara:strand:- start:991 stop:1701 length:711 start_codon:yes stop_codon:yes gene_type:complete